jgi:hypothetical protein
MDVSSPEGLFMIVTYILWEGFPTGHISERERDREREDE